MNNSCTLFFHCLFILANTFVFTGCNAVHRDYYPDGTLQCEIPEKGGRNHGIAMYYYPDGTKQMESAYVDGILDGQTIRYYSNGVVKELLFYSHNKLDSLFVSWDPMGRKIVECGYRDSLRNGSYTEYWETGQVKVAGFYKEGLFDGKWWYYDIYGKIIGMSSFSKGTGVQQAFHENGRVKQVIHYACGQKDGSERLYAPTGELITEIIYEKGKPTVVFPEKR